MPRHRTRSAAIVLVVVVALLGCGTDDPEARAKAEQLVDATAAAGVASGLTAGVAEALYGSDAAPVCDTFDGGLSSGEHLILLGNPSNRRHKTITDHSVEYARVVVQTYCPEHLDDFEAEVADLDPYESDRLQDGSP